MHALREAGLEVPKDVSIIGFADTELGQVVLPKLTTIRQPADLMGQLGAQVVLRQIDEASIEVTPTSLDPELILRESTAYVTN